MYAPFCAGTTDSNNEEQAESDNSANYDGNSNEGVFGHVRRDKKCNIPHCGSTPGSFRGWVSRAIRNDLIVSLVIIKSIFISRVVPNIEFCDS